MRSRVLSSLVVAVFLAGCTSGSEPASRTSALRRDVEALGRHFEDAHANLGALIPVADWRAEVALVAQRVDGMDANETLVEIMRLAALPGRTSGGDGHSGVFPLDAHERELHLFPFELYSFPEGLYVVDVAGPRDIVGERLVSIGDTPVEEVIELVEPLVPRDDDMTLAARLPQFLMTAEVLDGLGVIDGTSEAELTFENDVLFVSPIPAADFAATTGTWHPMIPPSLPPARSTPSIRAADKEWWSAYLPPEDVVYVQYDQTVGDSFPLGERIVRLVTRRSPRGVVLDLRHNPGGENAASAGLIEGLTDPAVRNVPLAVLIGRGTFSAAGNLSLYLQERTSALFVGEASGFSTRFFGDPVPETLAATGLVVNAGGVEWDESPNGALGSPLIPDVELATTAAAHFRGEDPVLAAALRRLHRD